MAGFLNSLLIAISTKGDISGLQKTDKAVQKTTKSLQGMARSTGLLTGLSQKLFGGINLHSFVNMGKSYLQFEKDLGAMKSRFYAITKDEAKANEEFEYIRQLATDTALDIKKTADSYSIFYSATRRALGEEATRGVFENWTKVGRVLHLSEYQMERVTYALREMASKGAIYSQDLRMQIGTHVPNAMGLAQKAAEEMGFTGTEWFENLQKAAKGNVQMTAQFVKLFSKYAEQEYGSPEALKKALKQPDALAKYISNMGYNFLVKFSEAGGAELIINLLQSVYNSLQLLPIQEMANLLGYIAKATGKIANALPTITQVLWHILQGVAMFYLLKGLLVFGRSIMEIALVTKGIKRGWDMTRVKNLGPMAKTLAFLAKNGLKSIVKTALAGSLGPLAPLVFLPEIFGVIKWIANKMGFKSDTNKRQAFNDVVSGMGLDPNSVFSILTDVKRKGPQSTEELRKMIRLKEGGKEWAQYATLNENGDIVININGVLYDTGDAVDGALKSANKAKKDKADGFFNKPSVTQERAKAVKGF